MKYKPITQKNMPIISNFVINQINPVVNSVQKITPVFTDNPGF